MLTINGPYQFSARASEAIGEALSASAGARNILVKSDAVIGLVQDTVQQYIETVAGQLVSASHGVDLRSRLLWWKEAKVSPSTGRDYADLDHSVAIALMAHDYQSMLPALAPVSVTAFLRQAVKQTVGSDASRTLAEHVETLSVAPELAGFKKGALTPDSGLVPLTLVLQSTAGAGVLSGRTVFDPQTSLTASGLASLLFLEAQALKAAAEIQPTEMSGDDENKDISGKEADAS